MVLNKSQIKAREIVKKYTRRQIVPVSDSRMREIFSDFYHRFAAQHKFYGRPGGGTLRDIVRANADDGFFVFAWQDEIIENILTAVFQQKSWDINISVLRQTGKTEMVALVTAFCFEEFFKEFHVPIGIAVFAPVKNTATIMFKRSTQYIDTAVISPDGDTKERKESLRGDSIQLFGIYDETKGSTIEGNTFDLIIRDEAHLGNDQKFTDETEPTRFAKRCPIVMIGNGGKRRCLFLMNLENGDFNDEETGSRNIIIRATYDKAKPYLKQLADRGYQAAKTRIDNIEAYIRKHGKRSYNVQKNVFCKWQLEYGNAVTRAQLQRCLVDKTVWDGESPLLLGLDIAKTHDRTIAIVMTEDKQIIDIIVVKESYTMMQLRSQFEVLKDYCDEYKYTDHIVGFGYDATGAGSLGPRELICELFPGATIREHTFTMKSKNEWYKSAIEAIQTEFPDNRIKIPRYHKYTELFMNEWSELTRKSMDSGYDKFEAPQKEGMFDDVPAATSICLNLVRTMSGMYYTEKKMPQKELDKLAEYENPIFKYTSYYKDQMPKLDASIIEA